MRNEPPILHELDLLIERATTERQRNDLTAVRDVCQDTPDSQSVIRMPADTHCPFCDTRLALPEDGGKCVRGCR